MQRRHFLRSSAAALSVSALSPAAVASESDTTPTAIPSSRLTSGWGSVDEKLSLPEFDEKTHEENVQLTEWNLDAFHNKTISNAVEESTPFSDVHPLTHLWTATVTPAEDEEFQSWQKGESAELTTDIDATTEAAFEHYVQNEILSEELYFAGEWHRKAGNELIGQILGTIPWLGAPIETFWSWKWEMQDTVSTYSGVSSTISEYYYGLPLTAISEGAEQHVENETTVDFRGLYIDWFSQDGVFTAAGAVYPENRNNLQNQLEDGLDEGITDFPEVTLDTEKEYEPQVLKMLQKVRSVPS
jgi:hypothetical protein